MKSMRVKWFACGILTLLVCLSQGQAGEVEDSRQAIRKVLDLQSTAWNKGDLVGFMKSYWKSDKLSFFSGGTKTLGYQATLERYQKRYQGQGKEMGLLTFTEVEIEPLGPESAFVRGRFNLVTSTGKPTGIFTLIVRKFPEGWLIVHDHTSADEPKPTPQPGRRLPAE